MSKCPLTGQDCPHHRCIHVTDVANYQTVGEMHLCTLCGGPYLAQQGGPEFNTEALQVFELINSAIKGNEQPGGVKVPSGCSFCGHTIQDIGMTGKLGCPNCYNFYKQELMPLIEKCQSSIKHVGKVPKQNKFNEIAGLEAELKKAVAEEDYAKAAQLRDAIKKLRD